MTTASFATAETNARLPRFLAADCSLKPKVAATAPPTVLSPSPSAVFTQRFSFFFSFFSFAPSLLLLDKKRASGVLLRYSRRSSATRAQSEVVGLVWASLCCCFFTSTREKKNSLTHQETPSRWGVEERSKQVTGLWFVAWSWGILKGIFINSFFIPQKNSKKIQFQ